MKHFLFLIFILISVDVFSQASAEEAQIRAVIQTMEDSYNEHDYSFIGKYDILSSDAWLINPVGMYWKNRIEITQALQILGNIRLKYESVKYTIKELKILAPNVALVVVYADGRVERDYNFPDGSKGGVKGERTNGMYSFTLTKTNKAWKINSIHITHIDPIAANLNPVKTSN